MILTYSVCVSREPRIVFFDLETMPNLKEVLKVIPGLSAYPGLTLKAQINSIICFGYKVLGEDKVKVINAWDDKRAWLKNVNNDLSVCERAYEILANADAIVSHNGRSFDWKFLQTRLMLNGLKPLHKITHIDTKALAKSNLYLLNNKLQTVGEQLIGEGKKKNGGWDLWVKVWHRDRAACKLMSEYCAQDVALLEKVFKKFRPFIKNIPNYNLFREGEKIVCPSCASTRMWGHGMQVTKTMVYKRFKCQDCGSMARVDSKEEKPRSV